jgi:hypothetical protein
MFRRSLIWGAVLIALGMVGLLLTQSAAEHLLGPQTVTSASVSGKPQVVLDRTEWDFGNVTAGETLRATFLVKNAGDRDLILLKHRSSCGCLTPDFSEAALPPGQSRELRVDIRTDRLHGPVRKRQSYTTNDAQKPLIEFTLVADVQPPGDDGEQPGEAAEN